MMRMLSCGCCTNGCMCSGHAQDKKRVVCLSHRADRLRYVSFDQFFALSDKEQDTGVFCIDINLMDPIKDAASEAMAFQRDAAEERDGTYR